jgi:hypothetical protein
VELLFFSFLKHTFHHPKYIPISVAMSAVTDWEVNVFKTLTVAVNKFDGLLHESIK